MSEKKVKEEPQQQMLGVAAQYTKDLSFETIMPATLLHEYNEQPKINVQLNVEVERNIGENLHEVSLIVNIEAKFDKPIFILQLKYAGEFAVEGFDESLVEPILYVECARLLFPFVRNIVAQVVSDGGFPPLYLVPVNFADLYQQQIADRNQTIQ